VSPALKAGLFCGTPKGEGGGTKGKEAEQKKLKKKILGPNKKCLEAVADLFHLVWEASAESERHGKRVSKGHDKKRKEDMEKKEVSGAKKGKRKLRWGRNKRRPTSCRRLSESVGRFTPNTFEKVGVTMGESFERR